MKKIFMPMLISFILLFSFGTSTFAASVGDAIAEPEEGWNRYEHTVPEISYSEGTWFKSSSAGTWNSPWQTPGSELKFNLVGTKIRFISTTWWSGSEDIDVVIDGVKVDTISLKGTDSSTKKIMYENLNLPHGEHSIEFKNNKNEYLFFYAIDTDGVLKPYEPVKPNPNPEPQPQPSGDRAILTVTMTNGLEKEFDLSMSEVTNFINWYDAKENGSGPARYGIDKHSNNKGPFTKRVDYVIFKNILSFEVDEYNN